MKRFTTILLLTAVLGCASLVLAEQKSSDTATNGSDLHDDPGGQQEQTHDDRDDHGEGSAHEADHGEEAEVVELSEESIRAAGIQVTTLKRELLPQVILAPGEIKLDQYRSAKVTPLIDAVVMKRHVRLGDHVKAGQPLITLASVAVATAQGQLRIQSAEWQRVRKLGKAAVSARRYIEAKVAYEQGRLKLKAYGLDDDQINAIAFRHSQSPTGQFQLKAPITGTVFRDDFYIGQRIQAGQDLFTISDENRVWVQANLPPSHAKHVRIGLQVDVNIRGEWHKGKVIQKHHMLDRHTRTIPVRIAIRPREEHHHTGEFVQISLALWPPDAKPGLAVPESALTQNDKGNWTVFVESKRGHFKRTPVLRGTTHGEKISIAGLPDGTAVVIEGAFYLAAELAKSGFEIHSH